MAIDTDNEKFALIYMHQIHDDCLPISSDGLDQADNQQLLGEYPGLLWGEITRRPEEYIALWAAISEEEY